MMSRIEKISDEECGHAVEDDAVENDAYANLYHQEAEAEAVMRACVLANQVHFPPVTIIIIIITITIIIILIITPLSSQS